MCEEHVGDVVFRKSGIMYRVQQRIVSVQVIVTEKLRVLFIAQPVVNEDQPVVVFKEQTSHGPGTQIVFIGGIGLLPNTFGNYTKHCPSI
jgi:hypothetical protein